MRASQLFAVCLALCAFACEGDDPDRRVVDLVNQTSDPSTAVDSSSPASGAPGDGGGVLIIPGHSSSSNGPKPMDASIRDAAPADASQDAGSSPYACQTNNDCTIRDVGNCCGYYPRCANANAIFTPPSCSGGQAGVCGFPAIDSCTCRQNVCRSLQAGAEL